MAGTDPLWNFLITMMCLAGGAYSFHDADNVFFDCWPLNAMEGDPTIDCGGLGLVWPEEPPDNVERGEKFNVTYMATATDAFYTNNRIFPSKSENMIRNFCQNNSCPEDPSQATEENCCVWHANIHTCHPVVVENRRICGPWVANNGELSTHTETLVGQIDAVFVAQDVFIDFVGVNFIIAHLRVGDIQIALGKSVRVTPRRVCGDGQCSTDIGETCETCSMDCCGVGFSVGATAGIVSAAVLVPIIVTIIILGWYYFRRRKFFYDESWIINHDDIQKSGAISKGLGHPGITGSLTTFKVKRTSGSDITSERICSEVSIKPSSLRPKQMFTMTGNYEGRVVAIKKMPRNDIILTNTVRKEVMSVRVLDHPNLCKFLGATVKNPRNLCIISEYCPKGSLNDVLLNDNIPLNWGFRFSFASDIARGMAYLHSKKIYHCRLTSSNCTIDDRWVLKISDYGLPTFRKPEKGSLAVESQSSDNLNRRISAIKIYMPPEVRGKEETMPEPTTDVYSYAILLVEIATRMDPFSSDVFLDENWKPVVTREHLTVCDSPCPCPTAYLELIDRCWSFMPANRPTFDQIRKTVDRINPQKESPVDMMMIMMEKYSKHLETLVNERTQELIAEQEKTAILLYSMLPQAVADDLKHGKPAPARLFRSATIYFSDIVGFTNLASTSTAFEVVNLLNELYSTFDEVLDRFDVYKVETIGDAYMVVSGVPQENGDKHAGEIATMALALLSACKNFKIPHLPDTKLEIRVGIHSGPVCAGVVGLKMPRYCLFGDTVNTASRMESNSQAMKIQCSDATYQILNKLGGFRMECRGNIPIKGKGNMVTWWLVGAEDDNRDSLTGMNLTKSEALLRPQRKFTSKSILSVHSENNLSSPTHKRTVSFKKTRSGCSPLPSPSSENKMTLPGTVTSV